MRGVKLIGVRHVGAAPARVPVLLLRNESGTISGQCLLRDDERPIIDGPSVASVLATIEDAIDALLMARGKAHS